MAAAFDHLASRSLIVPWCLLHSQDLFTMQSSHGLHTTRGTISKSTARCPPVHASGQQGSGSGGDASKPPAGATRRVTGRDLSRISKIFGPSRRCLSHTRDL
jgi:hypothetical protein